ncbi:glycosyltransferase family 4 protein [Rhodopseudomonas sp. HC1]|uniref:glycosyltransferase family 4 protein n=1 Tax=Rhodopseudomonas infernalis TaxID=2897386 RepID=UPI001EE99DE0|nr:glycosyltransferase family 4 protein [Rhodopseudomonas infernalis]MCG6207540.1 glycosyltransferase family 4 protein [Rhodopseudomonas infernalis]
MKVVLAIFKLEKQGGKERDCVAVARRLAARGHDVTLLTTSPDVGTHDLRIETLRVSGLANHVLLRDFARAVIAYKQRTEPDALLAFERIPGSDYHYVADGAAILRDWRLLAWPPRRRTKLALERAVFASPAATKLFFLTERQRDEYCIAYDFEPSRANVLPMVLHDDRYAAARRLGAARWRADLRIPDDALLAVSVAVDPKLKGVDRSLAALKLYPKLYLVVAGSDAAWLHRRVVRLDLEARVRIVPYVSEVMDLIAAADFMLHPARSEAAGQVIGEALLAGVPVLASAACGYAGEIERSGAGLVLPEPFQQDALVNGLATMIDTLPALRTAAAVRATSLQQQRGAWLSAIADTLERGAAR